MWKIRKNIKHTRKFPADMSSSADLLDYTRQCFEEKAVDSRLSSEYQLVVEEVYLKLMECADKGTEITVESHSMTGKVYLRLICPGKPVDLHRKGTDDIGGALIEEYSERIKQSYVSGVNQIVFEAASGSKQWIRRNLIAIIAGIIFSQTIYTFCSYDQLSYLTEDLIDPLTQFLVGCMQTISVPLIFFSIAGIFIKLWFEFEHESHLVRLFLKYLSTSLLSVLIGGGVAYVFCQLVYIGNFSYYVENGNNVIGNTLKEFINQFTFTNIVEPFMSSNPIPMLIMAIIFGIAASCMFGNEGNMIRTTILALNHLFAMMLELIYQMIPIFLFMSVTLLWMYDPAGFIIEYASCGAMLIISMAILYGTYAMQLSMAGLSPVRFIKNYREVFIENFRLGSNIVAFPYNKRVMIKKTGYSPDFIKKGLTLGMMMNMDGNCLVISMYTVYVICTFGIEFTAGTILSLTLIIMLISIGAPNRAGSFLISMAFIFTYLGISQEIYNNVIALEAFFGIFYPVTNSIGDIVTIAAEVSGSKTKEIQL